MLNNFRCPHCYYQAPFRYFENAGNGDMRCRRCRSYFPDPDAYKTDLNYADCDSRKPVFRFPFPLNGQNTMVRVPDGYLAYVRGANREGLWISGEQNRLITDLPGEIHVYYICLSPRVSFGTNDVQEFGVFGTALLSMTEAYVMSCFESSGDILTLEDRLRELVSRHVTQFVRDTVRQKNITLLEHRDIYLNVTSGLEEGLNIVRLDPRGYRDAFGNTVTFPPVSFQNAFEPLPVPSAPHFAPPVEWTRFGSSQQSSYTVRDRVEEVFIHEKQRMTRHKAGEVLTRSMMQEVELVLRFHSKEFEFPFGWGIYNQSSAVADYFSAQGEISFYIDSTKEMSRLLYECKNWKEFENAFFARFLKNATATALKSILNSYAQRQDFRPEKINEYLSAMSVDLTRRFNGEDDAAQTPVFKQAGLRVKRADILGICFYSDRR